MEEYLLILMRRDFLSSGIMNDTYGRLEDYFPGILTTIDPEEKELLDNFRKMNRDSKDIVKGKSKEVLRLQRFEDQPNTSVPPQRKAVGK